MIVKILRAIIAISVLCLFVFFVIRGIAPETNERSTETETAPVPNGTSEVTP